MSGLPDYKMEYIHVSKLAVVWPECQRPFNEAWARQIADEFDPEQFDPPTVTLADGAGGMYHIIKGQHSVFAVRVAFGNNQKIECHVLPPMTKARAAELFLGSANVKPIAPIAEFLVALESGRGLETAINTILRRAGYRVSYNRGPGVITCIGALKRVHQLHGDKVLFHSLTTCKTLWGLDSHGVAAPLVRGMGLFHTEFHGNIDNEHLRKAVHGTFDSPTNLLNAAKIDARGSTRPLDTEVKELLFRLYNKGLRDSKKLKRKE